MFTNRKSLKVVVPQKQGFRPPYCPNPKCVFHTPSQYFRYEKHSTIKTKKFPYVSVRFRCLHCGKVFSSSFFSITYRDKTDDFYAEILALRHLGASKREIAKELGFSLSTVLRKVSKAASFGLLIMAKDLERVRIKESIAFDGLENFAFSQYDPNVINHAVGRESYFTYDFNFCHLNRKGRMTKAQRKKKQRLEEKFGKYPFRAQEHCAKRIFERLLTKAEGPLVLHTDDHFMYRDALLKMKEPRILHEVTSSYVRRNFSNPLFAVNHLDLLSRHRSASFRRETIAFAKTSQAMIEDFILYVLDKNYMRSVFVKRHVQDPSMNAQSPAMKIGLRKKIQTVKEFFRTRVTKYQVKLSEDWKNFVERKDPLSRRPIAKYACA